MIKETDIKWLESILKATPEALKHIADNKSVAQNLFDAFSCLLIGEDIAKQLSYDRREDNIAGTNSLFWRPLIGIVMHLFSLYQLRNLLVGGLGQQAVQVLKHPLERLLRRALASAHLAT